MTKVKYSALVSEMRNKLNGSVLSKNRAGNYIRNKVTPVNPQTAFQQANRQRFGAMSASWRGLSEQQRTAWSNATKDFPYTDIFGDKKELDGKSLFTKLNLNLLNSNSTQITEAPAPVAIPALTLSAIDASIDTIAGDIMLSFNVKPAAIPAGYKLLVYASDPLPKGVSFAKNRIRALGVFTPATGVVQIGGAYMDRFGSNPNIAGFGVVVRAALVSNTTGQLGVPNEIRGYFEGV